MIYLELFLTFLKIGAFTFGGGYAMLPFIQEEVVAHNWLKMDELINFVAVSESTPGPFAVNIATYVGSETGGVLGALCATLGVVLPSFIIILIVAKCYLAFKNNRMIKGVMTGLRPVTVGLIGGAVLTIGYTVFFPMGFAWSVFATPAFWVTVGLALVSVFMAFKKVHPIIIISISAVAGIALGYMGCW